MTAERVGLGSSPRSSASPVSISEKVREVGTLSASSISLASTSRTPPLSVSRPSPKRLHGVCPDPLVPRSSSRPSRSRSWAKVKPRPSPRSGLYARNWCPW